MLFRSRGDGPIDYASSKPGTHETKMCTDCHVSVANDNNAIMAQLLMQGTNYTNFIGRYAWVGLGTGGLAGVVVTEQQEPQAVIGSEFHRIAFPDDFKKHLANDGVLQAAHHHQAGDMGDVLLRVEDVTFRRVDARLARVLLERAGPAGRYLTVTQQQLAEHDQRRSSGGGPRSGVHRLARAAPELADERPDHAQAAGGFVRSHRARRGWLEPVPLPSDCRCRTVRGASRRRRTAWRGR